MDGNGPELHKHEEAKVGELLEGEDEDEDVVGEGLEPAIKRVEGEGGEGGGNEPGVVGLVDVLVKEGNFVLEAVNPINRGVGEAEEEGHGEDQVPPGVNLLIQLRVATNLENHDGGSEDGHGGHAPEGELDLAGNLALLWLGLAARVELLLEEHKVKEV